MDDLVRSADQINRQLARYRVKFGIYFFSPAEHEGSAGVVCLLTEVVGTIGLHQNVVALVG